MEHYFKSGSDIKAAALLTHIQQSKILVRSTRRQRSLLLSSEMTGHSAYNFRNVSSSSWDTSRILKIALFCLC